MKSRFLLRFIGHIEEPRFRSALLQLGDMVELKGFMPQREALALMNETDYVLLINHDPHNVGGKFYDYLGSGKPILGAVHPLGDACQLIEELRAGWWADIHDISAIRKLFLDASARGKPPFPDFKPDTAKIAQYERQGPCEALRGAAALHRPLCAEKRIRQKPRRTRRQRIVAMLRIAVVTRYFPSSGEPWAGRSLYEPLRILARSAEVRVFYPNANYPRFLRAAQQDV